MELIGIENTVLTRLFLASNAGGGQVYLPTAAVALVERYRFAGYPSKLEDLSGERVSFKHGQFQSAAIDLDIFRDGIIVASKSPSDILDRFVDDLVEWIGGTFGLKKIETHSINKNYESYLVVRSEAHLLKALDSLSGIQKLTAQALKTANGMTASFEPVSLALAPDNTLIPNMRPIPLRVERRANVSFETNFYYSCAPLPTREHIKLLEQLEKLS